MSTSKPSFSEVWRRLSALAGKELLTKTGKPFTYSIVGEVFRPSRTEYNISSAEFKKAIDLVPLQGPGVISDIVRGPAYVWAVLHDKRIRLQDW